MSLWAGILSDRQNSGQKIRRVASPRTHVEPKQGILVQSWQLTLCCQLFPCMFWGLNVQCFVMASSVCSASSCTMRLQIQKMSCWSRVFLSTVGCRLYRLFMVLAGDSYSYSASLTVAGAFTMDKCPNGDSAGETSVMVIQCYLFWLRDLHFCLCHWRFASVSKDFALKIQALPIKCSINLETILWGVFAETSKQICYPYLWASCQFFVGYFG